MTSGIRRVETVFRRYMEANAHSSGAVLAMVASGSKEPFYELVSVFTTLTLESDGAMDCGVRLYLGR